MRRSRLAAVAAGGVGAVAAATALASALADTRTKRAMRVWRLTARNTSRFVATRIRRLATPEERRAELDAQFAIRSAEDVARELGDMKGVLMKVGQLVSYIAEGLPDEAQRALAALQADAEPMAPSLAAAVVAEDLGGPPERVFAEWTDLPHAAASVGQVHRARTRDGDDVAVKVQYPGVSEAIEADLDSAEVFYGMFSALALHGLDAQGFVEELRVRMREELDYEHELANLVEFAGYYAGHPWARLPRPVPELSSARVLTTEWVDGLSWNEFIDRSSPDTKQRAAEVIWRFAQHSVRRLRAFNGDPHPGNYRFHLDGSVTFLDFGLVKRWQPGEWERLSPTLDAVVVQRDPEQLVAAMEHAGFLQEGHALDPEAVFDYVSRPYEPYLVDEFRFSREWMRDTLAAILDLNGPHREVIAKLNMPASFVILDRVVWGVSALMGRLSAQGPWRAMLLEYHADAPPATELGIAEAHWLASRATSR